MTKLPFGLDVNNLIGDLRILSWEAADILIYYSHLIRNSKKKNNIIQNKNSEDPVTLADLKVNELIIKRKIKSVNKKVIKSVITSVLISYDFKFLI